jgi:hypothetical protein
LTIVTVDVSEIDNFQLEINLWSGDTFKITKEFHKQKFESITDENSQFIKIPLKSHNYFYISNTRQFYREVNSDAKTDLMCNNTKFIMIIRHVKNYIC